VKDAAEQAVPGMQLVAAELERTRNGWVYELEGIAEGKRYEVELTESGKVLEVELETDEEVALSEMPESVVQAAHNAVPGIKLVEAEIVQGKKGLLYEIEGVLSGKEYEMLVTPEGKVLATSRDTGDDDDDDEGSDPTAS
jgi:uncharacterized membrane protein YkoI